MGCRCSSPNLRFTIRGIHTIAQMIDANRQFINIVVPWMESQSWVAGYSWYNWFSDSALLHWLADDAHAKMGYNYIGTLGTGSTSNIGGVNYGEHVAYLSGGALTATSTPTLKYINALANTSTDHRQCRFGD